MRRLGRLTLVVFGLVGGLLLISTVHAHVQPVPTIFVHGLQGSHKSTDSLIAAAQRRAGATRVMTINVTAGGTLQVQGNYSGHVKRPLIQVNFLNNEASVATQTQWLTKVLTTLRHEDDVQRFNVVAHSAGNITVFETVTNQHRRLPKLNKTVILAGPFDGVIGMGDEPNQNQLGENNRPKVFAAANAWYPSYQQLLRDAAHFPKRARVLNIYSDLKDGTHSDGQVTVQSARSVDYLLHQRHIDVKDVQMTGLTHSELHESGRVDRIWIKFLWAVKN